MTAKLYWSYLTLLKPSGHYMYHQFNSAILRSAHTLYLCVLCGSENKQRLFPHTALTDWFLYLKRSVFTARYKLNGYYVYIYIMINFRPYMFKLQ